MNTRRSVRGNSYSKRRHSSEESEVDTRIQQSSGVSNCSNGNKQGKCRMSLMGVAVMERENLPLLSATYHYWTDQGSQLFHESVEDFQRIELSKVCFGLEAFKERDSIQKLNNGTTCQRARSQEAIMSNYIWSQPVHSEQTRGQRFSVCNTFLIGFASCMVLVLMNYFLRPV